MKFSERKLQYSKIKSPVSKSTGTTAFPLQLDSFDDDSVQELRQQEDSVLKCNQCSYQTMIDHLFHRHITKHSLDRPFQCPDCGYCDYNHTTFVDHMMDHQQTRILNCCFCKYRTNIFGMRLHIPKHRAVEPYDCSICEFSSNHPGSLKNHVFGLHTKKFSCNYCKKVMTKYALLKHSEEVHGVEVNSTQDKPFITVKSNRGMVDDQEDPKNNMASEDLLPLKLPTPKIVVKRILNEGTEKILLKSQPEPKVPPLTIKIPPQTFDDNSQSDLASSSGTNIGECEHEDIDVKPDLDALVLMTKPKTPKTVFRCNSCSFASTRKSLLRQHAPKHLLDRALVCTECDFKDTSAYIFAKHLASRRTVAGKVIYCCFCDYTTKSVSNMASHLYKHKPVSLNDCSKCSMSFTSRGSLLDHYRNMHVQKIECTHCGKWMTKHAIKKHRKTHVEDKPKKLINEEDEMLQVQVPKFPSKPYYKCSSCSFRTRMKSLLRRHVAKHLMPEAYWTCSQCYYSDSTPYRFAQHLKYHSEAGSYDCCFCSYSTTAIVNLARHMEVHRSVHFFDCSKCDKSFAQYPSLRKHNVEKHIEKHQCIECGEVMSLSKLEEHKKTHGAETPEVNGALKKPSIGLSQAPARAYKCTFCNYSTDIDVLVMKHIAKHTVKEAYFVCPHCGLTESHSLTFAKHLSTTCLNSHSCCFCDYSSNSDHNLSQHLEIHRRVHFHDCSLCDKSYSANASLFKHFKTYHVDEHTCLDCGEVVTYFELLEHKRLHGTVSVAPQMGWAFQSQEVDPTVLQCYHCTYTTKKKHLLRRHASKHLMDTRFVCPDCDFKENHAREFAKHCVSCQGGFNCCFCPFTSYDLTHVATHLSTHRPVLLYDCTECRHSANTASNMREHYKKMHVVEYKCPQCDEVMSRYKLRQHRLKHTMPNQIAKTFDASLSVSVCEPGSLSCDYCDYSTDIQDLLEKHVAKHQTNSDLICPDCGFSESNPNEFAKHLKIHSDRKTFDCCFCNFTTIHRGNLPHHLESHKSIHFFDCPKCDRSYSCKGNLRHHYDRFHIALHECSSCNAVMTKDELLAHEQMHIDQENPTYYCYDCCYKTKKKSLLRKHAPKHLEIFECSTCQFTALDAEEFADHLTAHSSPGSCCFCSYSTSTTSSLVEHLENHREGFDCSKCERSFSSRSLVVEHKRLYHKNKHRCSVCGLVMTYSRLMQHMKLHKESGVKSQLSNRLRCNYCAFTTKKKSLLRRHTPKHLIDNRLTCTMCSYKTNLPLKFAIHLETHSVDDTINCCYCEFSTKNKNKLSRHVDQHRKIHLFDCSKCDRSFVGSCGHYSLEKHFFKFHVQKQVCQKNIRPFEKCNKRTTLYHLLKHQALEHKAAVKEEVPYYVCRGPKFKE